ncbi:anti-sigma factor [Kineosporia babensis]|uniref:Regulator of SigK n=1 Tax=Kineosporia babensis TaxID=499548 RepID=A0A9X1SUC8_9ACTN|nr:anti-sigma factor [Kineosporia babensis]MCD5312311.1 anti-sigma factor [Kineosporia babensis]
MHDLSAAYALNALDEVERRRFERHLDDCPACTVEVREFAEAAASLAERVAEPAPGALRERVMADVARTRQVPSRPARSVRGPSWRRALTGAAAVLLVTAGAALGTVAWQQHQAAEQAQELADGMARVLTSPERVEARHTVAGGGTATMVMAEGDAVLSAAGIPAAPHGHGYQMWVIAADGSMQSGGMLKLADGDGSAFMTGVSPDVSLALTIEPEGGSDQPTTEPLVQLG